MRMPVDTDDWSLDLPEEWEEKEVARLSLWAQAKFLPALGHFVRETAAALGLDKKSALELEHAVDEAATNVIQHAFPGGSGQYTMIILRRPGEVVAALEDRGIPFDLEKFRHGESTGLGYVLIKQYADELRLYNRGPKGKRLEIIKKLPFDDVTAFHSSEELKSLAQAGPASLDEPLTVCRMEPDQAVALARCAYRAQGYSYISEYIYFPDQIREMLDLGRLVSCVAVNSDEEIVGHGAILPERPDAKVAEMAQALVDPPLPWTRYPAQSPGPTYGSVRSRRHVRALRLHTGFVPVHAGNQPRLGGAGNRRPFGPRSGGGGERGNAR